MELFSITNILKNKKWLGIYKDIHIGLYVFVKNGITITINETLLTVSFNGFKGTYPKEFVFVAGNTIHLGSNCMINLGC